MHSEKYGYLTSRLEDIGTSMNACVSLSLPKLGRELKILSEIGNEYHVTIGRDNDSDDMFKFVISNKSRLGHSEK
jgi:protein-arginine kinase